jgi:hypothetical protein
MLSQRSIETLIDLAENKLSQIIPFDRDDAKEIKILQSCVDELKAGAPAAVNNRRSPQLESRTTAH